MSGLSDFFGQVATNLKQMSDQRVGRASHIMLRPSADAADILNMWKADIADDEDKFQARARESSQCRSAPRGGDLGFVTRGRLSSEFDNVIFEEEAGFVYGPIRTQFGLHLIYLHSCREPSGAVGGMNRGPTNGRQA
jgi:peptidyl-prolyl cis-trans isomerase C